MEKVMKNLNVRQFTDYRTFLIAHAQTMKQVRPSWSFGSWSSNLGLKTTSSLTKIIQGKREAGPKIVEKFVGYFEFTPKDADYFRDLVRLHKVKRDPRLSLLFAEKMSQRFTDGAVKILEPEVFEVISNWYHLAIREMVEMDQFFEDPQWISNKLNFKVTARDVSKALDALLKLNLLRRDDTGKLVFSDGNIETSNDIASEAIKRYHEQMIDNAKEAVRKIDVNHREFQGLSLNFHVKDLADAKKLIRDFKLNFADRFETPGGDSVMQLQIQLFPLTELPKALTPA